MRLCLSIALVCFALPASAQDVAPIESDGSPSEPAAPSEEQAGYHVVVLSVGGDAPEAAAREVREAVAAALVEDGLRVMPEGDLALRFPPSRLRGCDSAACAWALGRELGVSMVAAVATWQREGRAASITVSLVVGERRAHAASEDVGERTIAQAAALAVSGMGGVDNKRLEFTGPNESGDASEIDESFSGNNRSERRAADREEKRAARRERLSALDAEAASKKKRKANR